jgi:CYTH domain-containing protein
MEIERKFLVEKLPPALNALDGISIRQGYVSIADNDFELRFRQKDDCFYQTIKQGSGLVRQESEIELRHDQFESLWPLTTDRQIQKVRYEIPLGDVICELDIFDGPLKGLQLVEVEFETIEQSAAFVPPDWFGIEVTDDRRYKNKQLAIHGVPKTTAA